MMLDAATISRGLRAGSQPTKESFPALPGLLYALRFILGCVCGLLCGLSGATGWAGFLVYAGVSGGGGWYYVEHFLGADAESYGGAQAVSVAWWSPPRCCACDA